MERTFCANHRTKVQGERTMTNELKPRKGKGWIKIIGIITLVGILIAVGRIVLRVFREKPVDADEAHGV
jgi:flagellar basal body-associated protein FliL